jgi:hypothetical protein
VFYWAIAPLAAFFGLFAAVLAPNAHWLHPTEAAAAMCSGLPEVRGPAPLRAAASPASPHHAAAARACPPAACVPLPVHPAPRLPPPHPPPPVPTPIEQIAQTLVRIATNWTYSLFFILGELWGSVAISLLFWSLADDVCTVDEAKTLYPKLGIAANVGLVLAGSFTRAVNEGIARGNAVLSMQVPGGPHGGAWGRAAWGTAAWGARGGVWALGRAEPCGRFAQTRRADPVQRSGGDGGCHVHRQVVRGLPGGGRLRRQAKHKHARPPRGRDPLSAALTTWGPCARAAQVQPFLSSAATKKKDKKKKKEQGAEKKPDTWAILKSSTKIRDIAIMVGAGSGQGGHGGGVWRSAPGACVVPAGAESRHGRSR